MHKEGIKRLLVCLLRVGKAAPIHAIIDVGVHPAVYVVHASPQRLWVQVQLALRRRFGEYVELVVEHADDLGGLVVDDGLGHLSGARP